MKLIGVISDTHGLLRPEVFEAFKGVDLILHGGDIGTAEVLQQLNKIAPVVAVRGNNDIGQWADEIPEHKIVKIGSVSIYMLHDVKEIDRKPQESGCHVVVSGHSHRPLIETRNEVLFMNPGSAGPRRFKLPISVGLLRIKGANVSGELVQLEGRGNAK